MAVYYKWIKGCAAGSTLTSGLWTYLKWGGNANSANNADDSAGKTTNNLPHIYTYIGKKDNPETENDLGYILTNAATDVSIESHWKFNNSCGFNVSTKGEFLSLGVIEILEILGNIHENPELLGGEKWR